MSSVQMWPWDSPRLGPSLSWSLTPALILGWFAGPLWSHVPVGLVWTQDFQSREELLFIRSFPVTHTKSFTEKSL